jgi:hypothetical protein
MARGRCHGEVTPQQYGRRVKRLWRAISVALLLGLLGACGDPGERGVVSRSDFGADWPFTVESGRLACEGRAITFKTGPYTYALNDAAESQLGTRGWLKSETIEARKPVQAVVGGKRSDTGFERVIERGLKLCGPPLVPGG